MINIYIKRIKDLREDKDKTQKEVAEDLGITQQQYSLYEKGNRTIPVDFLIMLSKYYKVSTDYILGLTDIKQPYTKIKNNININFGNVEMKWDDNMYKKIVARYQNKQKMVEVYVIETNILIKKMFVVEIYIAGRKSDIENMVTSDFNKANAYAQSTIKRYM